MGSRHKVIAPQEYTFGVDSMQRRDFFKLGIFGAGAMSMGVGFTPIALASERPERASGPLDPASEARKIAFDRIGNFIGPDGETMTEVDENQQWVRTEVSAAGQYLATYTASGVHYPITDWLGTKRVEPHEKQPLSPPPAPCPVRRTAQASCGPDPFPSSGGAA
jgi:hypothetical protein